MFHLPNQHYLALMPVCIMLHPTRELGTSIIFLLVSVIRLHAYYYAENVGQVAPEV